MSIVTFLVGVVISALFVSALSSLLTVFTINTLTNPEQGKAVSGNLVRFFINSVCYFIDCLNELTSTLLLDTTFILSSSTKTIDH